VLAGQRAVGAHQAGAAQVVGFSQHCALSAWRLPICSTN
jgi:hypothetical protein